MDKEIVIIKSQVKKWFHDRNFRVAETSYVKLNEAVVELMEKAISRTKLTKFKTITARSI